MNPEYISIISKELSIQNWQVEKTVKLFEEGATVPFIARYRKEMTGSLDEEVITNIRDLMSRLLDLNKRRDSILENLREQGNLSPELESQIMKANTLAELEDLYLPYRPKKKTRASIARERGLEPLARMLMAQNPMDVNQKATLFLNKEKEVNSLDDALAGARDIIAEWINETASARARIRQLFLHEAEISSKVIKGKEEAGQKYQIYFDAHEKMQKMPSHRLLALLRGENEEFLRINIAPPEYKALETLERQFLHGYSESTKQVKIALNDSYKRLMAPSIETEIRNLAKEKADKEAIRVFVENLRQLLLAPPLGQKNVLALDPGFRSGCKVVCLDKQGRLLHNETIYPHPPQNDSKGAINKIVNLVNAYKVEVIAVGNGTAGRETEDFIRRIKFDKDLMAVMVNESGASVYSASPVAREEFPDYDVTVRGAVSIGRRLMDPLAELVKIDPKSIGVGQYQHDVDQKALQSSLEDTVISCVNNVGVEVNTASKQLLNYVSGIGPNLSKNIVEYRDAHGPFKSREELKQVPRFGDKAFEQAAGFLRIRDGVNPLDASSVHPESYSLIKKMTKDLACTMDELLCNETLRAKIEPGKYLSDKVGMPTLNDILQELAKPGRDPRKKFDTFEFDRSVNKIQDLIPGMILPGIITNITAFGAFVDVGVHQDGLVHISQLSHTFVKDPNEVVKLNQKVRVKVMDVDIDRKRINLSIKEAIDL
ncbi:MAG: Tex family protein [Bacteroidota bacterium]